MGPDNSLLWRSFLRTIGCLEAPQALPLHSQKYLQTMPGVPCRVGLRTLGLDCYWHLSDTSVNQIPLLSLTSRFSSCLLRKVSPTPRIYKYYSKFLLIFFGFLQVFKSLEHLEFAFVYNVMEDPSFIFFWLLSKPPFSLVIGIGHICSFLKSSISFCP